MPKATRANTDTETPKKRTRKAKSVEGNGAHVAEPVTTAPAVADTTSEVVATEVPSQGRVVPEDLVRRRAYEIYLRRRGQGGSPEQDWFQALQEISGQHVA